MLGRKKYCRLVFSPPCLLHTREVAPQKGQNKGEENQIIILHKKKPAGYETRRLPCALSIFLLLLMYPLSLSLSAKMPQTTSAIVYIKKIMVVVAENVK